ncbi:c6 zinc finger domain-containing protein [Lasiosphaeria ovina]|uniref:C6 zinc finger domain-containing protein n=1 Tax=Lasiosphaeria ovina TaxID=92902 RepID=A0AAE0MYE1_9PEZI|nr:c6 zinc finger domain-containing protein [Lasiosphaeria ovina]
MDVDADADADAVVRRDLKRRKTRKGTRSCWACKRRKVKCTYARPTDDVCIGCARRCLDCVGQEFPEKDPGPSSKSRLVGDRIGRLESMIQQLAEQVGGNGHPNPHPNSYIASSRLSSPHRTLSQTLLAAYPSPSDLRIIGSTRQNLALYLLQGFVAPSHLLGKGVALELEKLWGPPGAQLQQYTAESHPVLIARQMLLLAGVLQHLQAAGSVRSSGSYQQLGDLSRPPHALARQLAEAATTLVTAHDRFTTGILEGVECLWLEAVYHEQNGNLRQSWLVCRRAISAVHLLGFQGRRSAHISMKPPKSILRQQSDGEAADLQQMWLRLVHSELALCLALELPPSASCPLETLTAVADSVTEDGDTNASMLERRHAAIASRLLERSERDPDFQDLGAALQIRAELEDVASAMPSGWWQTPSLADYGTDEVDDDGHLFEIIMNLRAQIFHFHLLLLAELPSMLQATCGEPTMTTMNGHHDHQTNNLNPSPNYADNSRNICVGASRDLLRCFIHLRSCERATGYFQLLDHYAWQAVVTLLLARLLDNRQTTTSLGGPNHQQQQQHRLCDRALASEAMEGMRIAGDDEEEDDTDEDIGSRDGLLRLLALDTSGAAVAVTYRKPGGGLLGNRNTLVLPLPFVGTISIVPQFQQGSASRGRSRLFGNIGYFPVATDDAVGPQGSDGDGDGDGEEDEEEEEDEDEAILMRAMKLRRTATWSIPPYMLRPV